jgi:hypothetical protein
MARGNVLSALAAARDLPQLSLLDALERRSRMVVLRLAIIALSTYRVRELSPLTLSSRT